MKESVDNAIKSNVDMTRDNIYSDAENASEEYVSSTLGLEDDDESKAEIKKQYIALYVETIKEKL